MRPLASGLPFHLSAYCFTWKHWARMASSFLAFCSLILYLGNAVIVLFLVHYLSPPSFGLLRYLPNSQELLEGWMLPTLTLTTSTTLIQHRRFQKGGFGGAWVWRLMANAFFPSIFAQYFGPYSEWAIFFGARSWRRQLVDRRASCLDPFYSTRLLRSEDLG